MDKIKKQTKNSDRKDKKFGQKGHFLDIIFYSCIGEGVNKIKHTRYKSSVYLIYIKGAGGVDFHFLVVSDRGECKLPGTFYGMKKYCS